MIFLVIGLAGLWFYTLYRGRLFVRAYMYLEGVNEFDMDENAANYMAQNIGYGKATMFAPRAKHYAQSQYGGKQLPIIAEARAKGFLG